MKNPAEAGFIFLERKPDAKRDIGSEIVIIVIPVIAVVAKVQFRPEVKRKLDRRAVKNVFDTDVTGYEQKSSAIRIWMAWTIVIPFADTGTNTGVPVETAVNVPNPLVQAYKFHCIDVTAITPSEVKLEAIVARKPALIRNLTAKTVIVAHANTQGILPDFLRLGAETQSN